MLKLAKLKKLKKYCADDRGGVAVYTAMLTVVGIGAGAAALDVGRLELLRNEMQNAADASAMAGVVFLNGQQGAQSTARDVAMNAMTHRSSVPSSGSGSPLTVAEVKFYSTYTDTLKIETTDDLTTRFIEVKLAPQTVTLLSAPILSHFVPSAATMTMNATAVASVRPYVCNAPPLMLCDLAELDPLQDPLLPANAGRQIRLKPPLSGSSAWAPGNYGLLALPDGSMGASDIENALAGEVPTGCYEQSVITATGVKNVKVAEGINVRFDIVPGSAFEPAPNVVNYPQDADMIADLALMMGNGIWDLAGYWAARHNGDPVPADLIDATRFQAYLYELGESFLRKGKETLYPVPTTTAPAGFVLVDPPDPPPDGRVIVDPAQATLNLDGDELDDEDDPDFDGIPQTSPISTGPARRILTAAMLQCIADNINGSGEYPTHGKYIQLFLTQEVRNAQDPEPDKGAIYGEVIRRLDPRKDAQFSTNASLVK